MPISKRAATSGPLIAAGMVNLMKRLLASSKSPRIKDGVDHPLAKRCATRLGVRRLDDALEYYGNAEFYNACRTRKAAPCDSLSLPLISKHI